MEAIDECGAPAVSIAGGEPLLHRDMPRIVQGYIARKKFVILCTNALLLKKKIGDYTPSPYFTWSIHLDGDRQAHDKSVCQDGVYDVALDAIRLALGKGFRTQINCTVFDDADTARLAAFLDQMEELGVEVTISPGYAYERAPDQEHFLKRERTKTLFRDLFRRGRGGKAWTFTNSPLFLDFLAGNRSYECTPWSMPLRTVFGWQKPCYLLGEGYVETFRELMDDTEWDDYGVGKYEKCANCMVHCGFEGTAASESIRRPLEFLKVAIRGVRTEGPMAPDIDLSKQRPAIDLHEKQVEHELERLRVEDPEGYRRGTRAA
jgi:hopanoid biosynthesis associated radical SAM protein HpnH